MRKLGPALGAVGLLNVQFAIADGELYVLEANPRASRTIPFVSKATGINLVDAACRLAAGAPLADLALPPEPHPKQYSVKAAVLPFARLPGSDPVLGPEMHATGEVMATAADVATALAKAERAAGRLLPVGGSALLCVNGDGNAIRLAHQLANVGVRLYLWPQAGAPADLGEQLPDATIVSANGSGSFNEIVRRRACSLVVATADDDARMRELRQAAASARVPLVTSPAGVAALAQALTGTRATEPLALQDHIAEMRDVDRRALEPLAPGATGMIVLGLTDPFGTTTPLRSSSTGSSSEWSRRSG